MIAYAEEIQSEIRGGTGIPAGTTASSALATGTPVTARPSLLSWLLGRGGRTRKVGCSSKQLLIRSARGEGLVG